MPVLTAIFWASCILVFYNYAGYAIIIYLYNLVTQTRKKAAGSPGAFTPTVSFIVAAFNEEDYMVEKIVNSLGQDYPRHLIEFIFITDGSTDNTASIIRQYPEITLLHEAARRGKTAALNRAVLHANNDILIFSDANALLNQGAVRYIANHYQAANVGGVAGEKKVISSGKADEVGAGEGLYWKYESLLKQIDSDFYSVAGAAGELISVRRNLYIPIPENVILDDFIMSLKIAEKGYRFVYEPRAYAMESASFSIRDEKKRKIRIAAGGFQSIVMLKSLLKFWKTPRLSYVYISHRVLRWTLSPLCLITAFISNWAIVLFSGNIWYKALFALQVIFYGMALAGKYVSGKSKPGSLCRIAYYFVFMNFCIIPGFFRFLKGKQPATWEKARRRAVNT